MYHFTYLYLDFFVQDMPSSQCPKKLCGFIITDFTQSFHLACPSKEDKDYWMFTMAMVIRKSKVSVLV